MRSSLLQLVVERNRLKFSSYTPHYQNSLNFTLQQPGFFLCFTRFKTQLLYHSTNYVIVNKMKKNNLQHRLALHPLHPSEPNKELKKNQAKWWMGKGLMNVCIKKIFVAKKLLNMLYFSTRKKQQKSIIFR